MNDRIHKMLWCTYVLWAMLLIAIIVGYAMPAVFETEKMLPFLSWLLMAFGVLPTVLLVPLTILLLFQYKNASGTMDESHITWLGVTTLIWVCSNVFPMFSMMGSSHGDEWLKYATYAVYAWIALRAARGILRLARHQPILKPKALI